MIILTGRGYRAGRGIDGAPPIAKLRLSGKSRRQWAMARSAKARKDGT
jgi:hypothetical protein